MTATGAMAGLAVVVISLLIRQVAGLDTRRRARRRLAPVRSAAGSPFRRGGTTAPSSIRSTGSPSALIHHALARVHRSGADRRYEVRLPVGLEALARALRAGTPLAIALREAASTVGGAVGDDLARAGDDLAQGVPSVDAFGRWMARRPLPGVRLALAALVVGTELGGSRPRAVDRVAARLRDRAAASREVTALASQARLSALVIAAAPLAFAVFGVAGNREVGAFLFTSPAGWACLSGGAALDAAALWWMTSIVRRAAS